MPPAGFELTIPARQRPQVYALGCGYIGARTDKTQQSNICLSIHRHTCGATFRSRVQWDRLNLSLHTFNFYYLNSNCNNEAIPSQQNAWTAATRSNEQHYRNWDPRSSGLLRSVLSPDRRFGTNYRSYRQGPRNLSSPMQTEPISCPET